MKKVLLVLTACVCVLYGSIVFGSGLVDAHGNSQEAPVEHKYYKSIEITSGDTLWGIAEEYRDEHFDSIYDYIDELRQINGLTSDEIRDTDYLTVVYYDNDFR